MNDVAFFGRFAGETARVVDCFSGLTPDEVGKRVLELHRRHADAVGAVIEAAVAEHRAALVNHALPATCLLVMAVSQGSATEWSDGSREQDPFQPWIAETEAEERSAPAETSVGQPLQLAVHPETGLVMVRDLVQLEAADSNLIRELRVLYDEDLKDGSVPENHRYIAPAELAKRLGYTEDASLRRRVSSCRRAVAVACERKHGQRLPLDALVQNKARAGYRLRWCRGSGWNLKAA